MECSRYFDCPTHVVERQLSDDEADAGEDEPTVHLQMEDNTTEISSSARLQTIEPAVPDVTSEPRVGFAPVPEPTTTDQPTEPANSAQATSARDTQGPVFPTSSTHRNTCATHWRVCPAGKVIEFGNLASCKRIVARLVSSFSLAIESTPYDAAPAASKTIELFSCCSARPAGPAEF
ncbi:hypothetical protein CSHISOI_10975 [Colletotrichum shisoi]|uniref:Uncharacterized protein n=1 Tax=Colletotrichum shisoi TaxID=2078593 RepID=A0A5Q4BC18_9PEZI|nr:hypothetical protein CSHISOI_10975 [Colletotrichum shisoi]